MSKSCQISASAQVVLKCLSSLDNHTVACKSSNDWLVSLVMDLVALCDIRAENGININGWNLADFSIWCTLFLAYYVTCILLVHTP